jgi:chromosomal replication initiation ATPase DnaA
MISKTDYKKIKALTAKPYALFELNELIDLIKEIKSTIDVDFDNQWNVLHHIENLFSNKNFLQSRLRKPFFYTPRALFFWYLYTHKKYTLDYIGSIYKYDHVTIRHAVHKIRNLHFTDNYSTEIRQFQKDLSLWKNTQL